jgi:hypothetical protein
MYPVNDCLTYMERGMSTNKSAVSAVANAVPPQEEVHANPPRTSLGEVARAVTDEIGLTTPENSATYPLSAQQIYRLIQESAYYRAEARGFSPGYEEQDWLEAEAEMKARLGVKQPGTD